MLLKLAFLRCLPAVLGSTPIVVSGLWIYSGHYPKSIDAWLKKGGYLICDRDEQYEAMFFENKDSISVVGNSSLNSSSTFENAKDSIKEWCSRTLKSSWNKDTTDDVKKFCIYAPTTLGGVFLASKQKFIGENSDEEYKVVFANFKSDSSASAVGVSSSGKADEEYKKVETFCKTKSKTSLELSIDVNKDLKNLFVWCTPLGFTTLQEKIKKLDPSWEKVGDDGWSNQYETWKHTTNITNAINSVNSSTESSDDGNKMKTWCNNSLGKKVYEDGVLPTLLSQVKSACSKSKTAGAS